MIHRKSRRYVWLWLTVAGVFYQGIRAAFGLEVHPMQVIDSSYWSAAALGVHWAIEKGWL